MKNFASIYSSGNDASAFSQKFFVKKELVRGQMIAPTGADFLLTLSGGGVMFNQEYESSPHRSGRHNQNIILQKTTTEWNFPTFINIDTGVAYGSSIDPAMKALWEAVLGKATDSGTYLNYDSSIDPSVTLTIFENLDHLAKQTVGCFVEATEIDLPGDGQAQLNWSGSGKYVYHAGIAKSTEDNNTGNTFTCDTPEEALRFDVGSMVMIVESNGTTRSADTPTGTPRKVVSADATTGVVTLDGAVLADADGSVNPVYLCYYEPETPHVSIDNPQTGLKGSISVDSLPGLSCARSAKVTITNNHEKVDYCYGTDGLSGALFVPGGRLEVTVEMELNLNAALVEFLKRTRNFESHSVTMICGDDTSRHFKVLAPKVKFKIPEVSVPESGAIPISFSGLALQTATDAADELNIRYA